MPSGDPIIGLDLGTSKTCAASVDPTGVARLLAGWDGQAHVPSVISFHIDGNVLVGHDARKQRPLDPRNTLQCDLRPGAGAPVVTRAGLTTQSQVQAILLDHVRRLADGALGVDTRRVILSIPAGLAAAQRDGVLQAAAIATLEVAAFLTSPAAVAYAYGLDQGPPRLAFVYDFGGGKFEATLLEMRAGSPYVLASVIDPALGGIDLDKRIVDLAITAFRERHGVDLSNDEAAVERLFLAAEDAKHALSTAPVAAVRVARLAHKAGAPLDLDMTVPVAEFERRIAELVDRSLARCDEVLAQAGVAPAQVADLFLSGGVSRVPLVQRRVAERLGKWGRLDIAPEEACALGAARVAAHQAEASGMRRITAPYGAGAPPPPPGVAASMPTLVAGAHADGSARVGRVNTKKMFTAVMQVQPEVSFTPAQPVLVEALESRLALSTVGGFCDEIIPASVAVPVSKTRVFSTGKDNQPVVSIKVCQGPSRKFAENRELGTIVLDGLPPRARGKVKIEVTFAVDADGVLEASAKDQETGQARSVRINLQAPA